MLRQHFLWINETVLNNIKLRINLTCFSQTKELKSSIFLKFWYLKCFNISDIKTWTTNQILQILTNNLLTNHKSYPRPIHSTMLLWKFTIYRSGTWLQMVCNNKLMKLITKGIELRCWDKAKSSIIDGMNGTFNSFVTEAVLI